MLDGITEDFDGLDWMELGLIEGLLRAQDDDDPDGEDAGQYPWDDE